MEQQHDLAKWLAGEMTETELARFRQTAEYQTYSRIASYSADLRPADLDEDAMLASVLARKTKPKTIPLYKTAIFRVAAMLVIALGLFFIFRPTQNLVSEMAANGTKAQATLPDASQVTLNSGSKIEYDKSDWGDNRSLKLTGEALFKVAKGKKFDVMTNSGSVTVVGTQFNVKSRGDRFEVDCFEGKVLVKAAGSELFLEKGEFVVFENGKQIAKDESARQLPDWMRNELSFRSASLIQMAEELERVYDIDIEVKARTTSSMTGALPANDLEKAIAQLCSMYSLNAETIDKKVVLSANE